MEKNLRPAGQDNNLTVPAAIVEDKEREIDLVELFYRILENVRYIILAAVIGAVVMFLYTNMFVTPMYRTVSKLYVLNSNNSVINIQDLQIGSSLATDYQEVFLNWNLHELAIQKLEEITGKHYTYNGVSSRISVSMPNSTRVMYITATSPDPDEAKLLADTYADVAREFIATRMDTKEPNVFQYALRPSAPYSPNKSRNTAMGFLLGAFIALAVITLRYLMDDKVHSSEDVEKHLGIPTLGVMPLQKTRARTQRKTKPEGRSAS